jgi:hypothetical protein
MIPSKKRSSSSARSRIRVATASEEGSEAGERRLRLAAGLAHEHSAHLAAAYLLSEPETIHGQVYGPGAIAIGIGITGPAVARVGEGSGAGSNPDRMPDVSKRVLLAETVERRFRETLQLGGIAGDWHLFARGEAAELIALAKAADLVIVGQHLREAPPALNSARRRSSSPAAARSSCCPTPAPFRR